MSDARQAQACARCGRDPAEGYAFIDDDRYCHGDGPGPSCYEAASWSLQPDPSAVAALTALIEGRMRGKDES